MPNRKTTRDCDKTAIHIVFTLSLCSVEYVCNGFVNRVNSKQATKLKQSKQQRNKFCVITQFIPLNSVQLTDVLH